MVSTTPLTVALVGNPNTGKTTLFNALSGLRQRVGNYPGVTVELKKGQMTCDGRPFEVIDLPGTYSLAPRSPDEMVAVDVVLGQQPGERRPDVVVSIVDASNLERNLYLTTQVLELGVPVVIALNMVDVAEANGLKFDVARLERQLGVRVVPIQANKEVGLDRLKPVVAEVASGVASAPRSPVFPESFERETASLQEAVGRDVPPFLVRRLLLDVGGYTEERLSRRNGNGLRDKVLAARQRLAEAGCGVPAVEAKARYAWIREAVNGCVTRPAQRPVSWTDRLDHVLTHRVWGTLIFLAVMFVVFMSIFWLAQPLMGFIDTGKSSLADLFRGVLPAGPLSSLLIDGVLEGVGSVVIFLPQILILFLFIAVLEDCGYMARAAFLMDRLMSRAGLSGKSFIPMLSSMACAVPGIMATRVIENRRDRLATILVAPLMSCSARLPVYILLIGAFVMPGYGPLVAGLVMFAMYLLGLVVAPLVAYLLKRTLLRGETPVFVMEMPSYKWPSWKTVAGRVRGAGGEFLRRAGTLILASMVVVWALLYFPAGDYEERVAAAEEVIAGPKARLASGVRGQESGVSKTTLLTPDPRPLTPEEVEYLTDVVERGEQRLNDIRGEWKRNSYLGQMGRAIEPVVRPLGWDWKIGMAALASFPAREVVVGTLGIIYNQGDVDAGEFSLFGNVAETKLGRALADAEWEDRPGEKVFTIPTALSLMVFFALCCQCVSTLAVIRRETRSWGWPVFTFVYMTVLAYVASLVVYQVGSLFV